MAQTKPAGTWTYEDLFSLSDDSRRYEIIEGELYEMPSPGSAHALMIAALIRLLMPLVENLGGWWCAAPIDVFFPGANPVQPDILVILPGGPARIVPRGIEGAPDLLVEVLSPLNRGHDLLTKRALYARAGGREHWLVDQRRGRSRSSHLTETRFIWPSRQWRMRRLYRRCLAHFPRLPPLSSPIATPDTAGRRFPVRLGSADERG